MTLEYFRSYGCSDKTKELYDEIIKLKPYESHRLVSIIISNTYEDSDECDLQCCNLCGAKGVNNSSYGKMANCYGRYEGCAYEVWLCDEKCINEYEERGIVKNLGYWQFECVFHSHDTDLFSMLYSQLVINHLL